MYYYKRYNIFPIVFYSLQVRTLIKIINDIYQSKVEQVLDQVFLSFTSCIRIPSIMYYMHMMYNNMINPLVYVSFKQLSRIRFPFVKFLFVHVVYFINRNKFNKLKKKIRFFNLNSYLQSFDINIYIIKRRVSAAVRQTQLVIGDYYINANDNVVSSHALFGVCGASGGGSNFLLFSSYTRTHARCIGPAQCGETNRFQRERECACVRDRDLRMCIQSVVCVCSIDRFFKIIIIFFIILLFFTTSPMTFTFFYFFFILFAYTSDKMPEAATAVTSLLKFRHYIIVAFNWVCVHGG